MSQNESACPPRTDVAVVEVGIGILEVLTSTVIVSVPRKIPRRFVASPEEEALAVPGRTALCEA